MHEIAGNLSDATRIKMLRRTTHVFNGYASPECDSKTKRSIEILCMLCVNPYQFAMASEIVDTIMSHDHKLEMLRGGLASMIKEMKDLVAIATLEDVDTDNKKAN